MKFYDILLGKRIEANWQKKSGAIASFNAIKSLKSLLVDINPIQAGSGDPSPDNVRTISGHSSVNVFKTGVNVWDEEVKLGYSISGANGNDSEVANTWCTKNFIPLSPNTVYYLKSGQYLNARWYDENKNYLGYSILSKNATFNSTNAFSNAKYLKFNGYGTNYNNDISINYPSTDTDYHLYNSESQDIPISLGQTVYAGKLDVISGKLIAYPYYEEYDGETLTGEWICDKAKYSAGTTPPEGSQVVDMSGIGTEYQLTPTEITLLAGTNNIWSDVGNVSATYKGE